MFLHEIVKLNLGIASDNEEYIFWMNQNRLFPLRDSLYF